MVLVEVSVEKVVMVSALGAASVVVSGVASVVMISRVG